MKNWIKKVEEFNTRIPGLPIPTPPEMITGDRKTWAIAALSEELQEFKDAETIEDQADALVDLIYFSAGRIAEMGLSSHLNFEEVHKANMQKTRGSLSKRPGSKGHDAVKPEGWKPPQLAALPKVVILGHAKHGKDTVAELLHALWGFRFSSTSMLAAKHIIMDNMSYATVDECYRDRVNNRAKWFDLICSYNEKDPARFAKLVFQENDIYVGCRSAREVEAITKAFPGIHCLWIDRSVHVQLEGKESFEDEEVHSFATDHIDNNGDIVQLVRCLKHFMKDKI